MGDILLLEYLECVSKLRSPLHLQFCPPTRQEHRKHCVQKTSSPSVLYVDTNQISLSEPVNAQNKKETLPVTGHSELKNTAMSMQCRLAPSLSPGAVELHANCAQPRSDTCETRHSQHLTFRSYCHKTIAGYSSSSPPPPLPPPHIGQVVNKLVLAHYWNERLGISSQSTTQQKLPTSYPIDSSCFFCTDQQSDS